MSNTRGITRNVNTITSTASPYYFFHGEAAGDVGESKFNDISGKLNDGVFGANLSIANAWTNAGYVSTVDPAGGATNSVIRIPAVNLDYNAGESLFGIWIGIITPEGSNVEFMGDGGFSTTYPGWGVRVTTAGKAQLKLADATNTYFSGTTTATAFAAATLGSCGFLINGTAKTASIWVNEVLDVNATSLNSGNAIDTRTTNTVNIGTTLPAAAASTTGIATQTRALALLRFGAGVAVPSLATLTALQVDFRNDPTKRISAAAL